MNICDINWTIISSNSKSIDQMNKDGNTTFIKVAIYYNNNIYKMLKESRVNLHKEYMIYFFNPNRFTYKTLIELCNSFN